MRVLVTGGAGFIGSHLSRRLLAEGHTVAILDNESTGRAENVPAGACYVRGDVTRRADLDAVCHVAGQVSIIRSFSDPVADLRTNVEGTLNVLRLCVEHRVPRLLYASSMTVYGACTTIPTPETEPCRPDSYYGIAKYAAERYVHATAARPDLGFPFHVTSLRMYSVYGPVQALDNPYQGVLGIFLGNLLRGEPLTIYGDGEQSRDFVYIDDIVQGWVLALDQPATFGEVINLGSGRALTINQLAERALAAFGRSPSGQDIVRAPARPGEQRAVRADAGRARRLLGWAPRVDFATGLAQTVRWARTQAGAGRPALAGRGGVR
jgi:UDP-glucose 4-epimerase